MAYRRGHVEHVAVCQLEALGHGLEDGPQRVGSVHCAFRLASRARREEECGNVIGTRTQAVERLTVSRPGTASGEQLFPRKSTVITFVSVTVDDHKVLQVRRL